MEAVRGTIERVTFHSLESGYCVVKIKVDQTDESVTVVGTVPRISTGQMIEATGVWTQHKDFGRQFKASSIESVLPTTLDAIESYLGSGVLKGIGPHFAKKIVKLFGLEVFEMLDQTPEQLNRVEGLGNSRIEGLIESWKSQRVIRELVSFLQTHGISPQLAVRVYRAYGPDAVRHVRAHPYRLVRDVRGITFECADGLAQKLGIGPLSMVRMRAGLEHVLRVKLNEGHSAWPKVRLLEETASLLARSMKSGAEDFSGASHSSQARISTEQLEAALQEEVDDLLLVEDTLQNEAESWIYLENLFNQEQAIARNIERLSRFKPKWGEILDLDQKIRSAETRLGITLDQQQRLACERALTSKLSLLTGGPGTGKTTITQVIISVLSDLQIRIRLASPTGRASKRLSECTGREAVTLHRLLGYERESELFTVNSTQPLNAEFCLLDEASMVDLTLMHHFLEGLTSDCAVLFVGDADQIPSVGPGRVLDSLIQSGVIATTTLNEVYRQAKKSEIIQTAHRLKQGAGIELAVRAPDSDFHFISSEDPKKTLATLIDLTSSRIPKRFGLDPVTEVQVLSPMNRGPLGTRALNVELQKVFNPDPLLKVERFGTTFAVDDKVMVTVNDYDKEVFNGDIGWVTRIDPLQEFLIVDVDDREIRFQFDELDTLSLAYATTIHKSQGSEYPAVVILWSRAHRVMCKRNLLYTAITRGKNLVVLLGSADAVHWAENCEPSSGRDGLRLSRLECRLRDIATSRS